MSENLFEAAGIETEAEPQENVTPEVSQETSGETLEGADEWFLAPGIKGEGEKPEYFNDKTFKTMMDQAKSQPELRKVLGSFTGAPEKYEYDLGEDFKDVEIDSENPLLKDFEKYARDSNMSQEGFSDAVKLFVQYSQSAEDQLKATEDKEYEEYMAGEIKKIDENPEVAKTKLKELATWWAQQDTGIPLEKFNSLITSADAYEVINTFRSKVGYQKVPNLDSSSGMGATHDELREMMNDPKYLRDNSFRQKVDNGYAALFKNVPVDKLPR